LKTLLARKCEDVWPAVRRDQFAVDVVLASIQFSQWKQKESNLRFAPEVGVSPEVFVENPSRREVAETWFRFLMNVVPTASDFGLHLCRGVGEKSQEGS
jgi:hypothetical protein